MAQRERGTIYLPYIYITHVVRTPPFTRAYTLMLGLAKRESVSQIARFRAAAASDLCF